MKTGGLSSQIASVYSRLPQILARRQSSGENATTVKRTEKFDAVLLSREAVAQEKAAFAQKLAAKNAQEPPKNPVTTPASETDHGGHIGGGTPAPTTKPKVEPEATASTLNLTPEPESPATPAVFGQTDLDSVRSAFGARAGDKNFSTQADADGNGIVDFRDLTHVLANWGQSRTK